MLIRQVEGRWLRKVARNETHTTSVSGRKILSSVSPSVNASQKAPNDLNVSLVDIGEDDHGNWFCYTGSDNVVQNAECWNADAQFYYDAFNSSIQYGYSGALFAAVDISYTYVALFQSDPYFLELQMKLLQQGSKPPGLQDASVPLEFRYSVDGTALHDQGPSCAGVFTPPRDIVAFEYSFKTRLRLWNSSAEHLRVWLCVNSSTVKYVSEVNIREELALKGIKPLEPGPHLALTVPLTNSMSNSAINKLQTQICQIVWSSVDERCMSRIWLTSESNSQLVFTLISFSNSRITRAGYLASQLLQSDATKSEFPMVIRSDEMVYFRVTAPGPRRKLNRSSLFGCVTHYDCEEGLFCSSKALMTFAKGFRGAGGPGPYGFACDLCKYCLNDFSDPIDVQCPRDKCGVKVGQYPNCVDTRKLFGPNFQCQDRYALNMSQIPPVDRVSPTINLVSISSPNSTVRKARFLTPYNQLFGAVTITQKRLAASCPLRNDSVGRYSATKDPRLGPICRGSVTDSSPFGRDPAFSSTSSLYRGDISKSEYYSRQEIDSSGSPYGFFQHSYDGVKQRSKSDNHILDSEKGNFKLYFSEQLKAKSANRLMTYMMDGGFIDFQTDTVAVEIITLNSNLNMFAVFTFIFTWQVTRSALLVI
jgi:hypothetical protein